MRHAALRGAACVAAALIVISAGDRSSAGQAPADAGFRSFAYGDTPVHSPTGEKAQSKLWWAGGAWWGCMFSPAAARYHIYRLDGPTHEWIDTGVEVDDRPNSKADVLWDQDSGQLYIVSNFFSSSSAASPSSARWGRLYRYTYLAAEDRYLLDSGFPVTVTNGSAEALTIAKDSSGRLWVTWVENGVVKINYSLSNDVVWNEPSNLPVGAAGFTSSDDISAIVAFGGGQIGVMWSNQKAKITYFAVRRDTDAFTLWQAPERVMPVCTGACSDDHLNLKTDSTGRVYAVTKTSFTAPLAPLIVLSVRDPQGVWRNDTVAQVRDHHTRPIVLVAESVNQVFVFASQPETGGSIYYKNSPLDSIAFAPGLGTLFVASSDDPDVNNATSTKGPVSETTGIVVLASDPATQRYLHNELALAAAVPEPVGIKDITFEDGNLLDPATGVDRVIGSVNLESGSPLTGAYSARVAGGNGSYLEENFADVDDLIVTLDIRVDALPVSDVRIVQLLNAGTTVGNLVLLRTGALQLHGGLTAIGAGSATLAVGQLYRIKLRQKRGTGANGVLEASLVEGNQPFGSAFASLASGSWTTAVNRLRVGGTKGSVMVTLDRIHLAAATAPPSGAHPQ